MLIYLLKSTACMAIFLLFYKLLLEKENMHLFKRCYLLVALVVSFIISGLVFVEYVEPAVTTFSNTNAFINDSNQIIANSPAKDIDVINWSLLAWSIYSIGFAIFGIRFLRNLLQILSRIRKNPKLKELSSIKVLLLEQLPPHTFFKYIFLNKEKFEANTIPKEVLLHEEIHAKQRHSIDVIFVELLQVVLWFNPLIFFFKKCIKLNHEFLADSAVIKKSISTSNYQNTLLSYLSQDSLEKYQSTRMANAINYSSIKKRFKVMKTHTSKKAMLLRSLLLLPLLAMMLYGFSETKIIERINSDEENQLSVNYVDPESTSNRKIELAGLVIDNESLLPLENVEIYSADDILLSKTDNKGFYKVVVNIPNEGEIFFSLTLKKNGYKPFLQKEHWGDLQNKTQGSLFIGLKQVESNEAIFSDLFVNVENLSYSTILQKYEIVKERIEFQNKIKLLQRGNQDILIEIDSEHYLTNKSGWIKINSKNDLVSIDDTQIVPAFKINKLIDRKDITGMTTVNNSKAKYAIYTIPVDHVVKPINKATQEQLLKFNVLAEKYNAVPIKNRIIPLEDLKILESIYRKMSSEQKEHAQPFPKCQTLINPIEISITSNGQLLVQENQIPLEKLDKFLSNYNSALPKSEKKKIIRSTIRVAKNIEKSTIRSVENILIDYGVATVDIIGPDEKKNIQEGTSREQMKEYNALAKKYNEMSSGNMRILMKDVERLKYIYSIMSSKQKADAEPFPDFPEPPPPPNAPDARAKASNKIKEIIEEQDPYDVVGGNFINKPPPASSPKVPKGEASDIPPPPPSPKVLRGEASTIPPPPPAPIEPVDHIIEMAKKGASFYFEGKSISSDKAIELIKKDKDLNIQTSQINSKKPQVKISKEPIKIGDASKSKSELLDYALELEKKNAKFFIDDKSISSKKALAVIAKKVYNRVETFPFTNKTPEVRIYTLN